MKIGGSAVLHAADLHRRGVGAQEHVARARRHRQRLAVGADQGRIGAERRRVDVEGVLEHPRRMPGRVVEGGEVVVVVLDLGTLHDPVAEADEDVLDLAAGAGQRVQVAEPRPAACPGSVTSIALGREAAVELGPLEPLARPPRAAPRARLRASLPALPTGPRCSARQLADAAQDRRQLGLAAQEADPGLLERQRRRPAASIAARASARSCFDPLQHQSVAPPAGGERTISAAARSPPPRRR